MDLRERATTGVRRHPWETTRSRFFLSVLRDAGLTQQPMTWLDVGAGDGWFAGQLVDASPPGTTVTCWDKHYGPGDLQAGAPAPVALVGEVPAVRYDAVLLMDVLEHIEDDVAFLRSVVSQHLAPDGWVLVTVPAHQRLYGQHDAFLRHFRRYSRATCGRVLTGSGLVVQRDGGVFHTLAMARGATVIWERIDRRPRTQTGIGTWTAGPRLTATVESALGAESRVSGWLSRHGRYVPGLSYWALCRHRRATAGPPASQYSSRRWAPC